MCLKVYPELTEKLKKKETINGYKLVRKGKNGLWSLFYLYHEWKPGTNKAEGILSGPNPITTGAIHVFLRLSDIKEFFMEFKKKCPFEETRIIKVQCLAKDFIAAGTFQLDWSGKIYDNACYQEVTLSEEEYQKAMGE